MASFRPVLASTPPATPKPLAKKTFKIELWTFGFRFFRQIEYFGLEGATPTWFASLLAKLHELSKEPLSRFLSDGVKQDAWRYHGINWNQTNIPIQRADLNWLDVDYLNNPDEYPLVQWQISQSLGRVVGFFDESGVFQIVLLDRMHNIQPAKSYNYRVDRTSVLSCNYTALRDAVSDAISGATCSNPVCQVRSTLQRIELDIPPYETVMFRPPYDEAERANAIVIAGKAGSMYEIFQFGLLYLEGEA